MKYKGVIFDLDGTLLDTLEDLADSMNAVLERHQFPVHSVESYKSFVGEGVEFLVVSALGPGHQDDLTVANCTNEMRGEYMKRWADKTKPYEGIPELLDGLSQRGVKLAVLSNKPDEFTQRIVKKLLSRWMFIAVSGSLASVPKKPDPGLAATIAAAMGLPPSQVIFLGDTRVDMKTAVAAGMFPVGALWGFRSKEELVEAGAKALITTPEEFLDLL